MIIDRIKKMKRKRWSIILQKTKKPHQEPNHKAFSKYINHFQDAITI